MGNLKLDVIDIKAETIKKIEVSWSPKVGLPISANLGVRMSVALPLSRNLGVQMSRVKSCVK